MDPKWKFKKQKWSPQIVGEELLYLYAPTALVTMIIMEADPEYLLMTAKLTGASLWTSYCTLWIQSQPWALYPSNSGTFQGSVTYPILSQLKVKHGL